MVVSEILPSFLVLSVLGVEKILSLVGQARRLDSEKMSKASSLLRSVYKKEQTVKNVTGA